MEEGQADGFTIESNSGHLNESDKNYVAWCWDMGGSQSSNSEGSRTTAVRASTTYGQSVFTFTGNDGTAETVGHGLDSTPEFFIIRNRNGGSWYCWHKDMTTNSQMRS